MRGFEPRTRFAQLFGPSTPEAFMPLASPRSRSLALLLGLPLVASCEAPTAPGALVCESGGLSAEISAPDLGLAVEDAIRVAESLPSSSARASLISRLVEVQQATTFSGVELCRGVLRSDAALDEIPGDDATLVERAAIRFVLDLARASAAGV